ncbi:MAG: NAD(P)/FAD-dependent oxidoreductase [Paracoccaceae bacterium]|nr:NAD(P)/FAD-dependent oxidoreductase [Paracoccaceae bacterium]
MSQDYDAVVIGSGLGGLTAGALLSHAGARVLVLERNASLGGAATTYHRGALTIEASLHETTPPDAPGDPKRELFELLGLEDEIQLIPVPTLHEVRWRGLGEPFQLPHGFDNIEAALGARFPEERDNIRALLTQVRRTLRIMDYGNPEHGAWWRIRNAAELPLDLWAALRDMRSSLSEVFERYLGDNEALKFALFPNLPYYTDDPDTFWWMGFATAQGSYMHSGGHYIRGGSQRLTDQLEATIREAGGEALTNSPATGIDLGPDGAVAGVRYRQGEDGPEVTVATENAFSNAAPHVLQDLLPKAVRASLMKPYEGRRLSISLMSATLGLDKPAAEFGIASYSTVLFPDWMERLSDFKHCAPLLAADPGERLPAMCVVNYGQIDSGLAEGGLHTLNMVCADRLENWEGLDSDAYRARRDAWLDALIARIDAEWPGIAGAVKARTMSTARTMHEHLNTPGGAIYGFAMVPPKEFPRKAPGTAETPVEGLWISSAYTMGGGFSGAIGGGIAAARAAMGGKLGDMGAL